jgi:hypothetical protein
MVTPPPLREAAPPRIAPPNLAVLGEVHITWLVILDHGLDPSIAAP